ncbi:MAG: hypothetical protein IJU76_13995 [Desulfovibrionaceae bacterium]|nr:hypothetical protein [Desulfovibrionaceae bacterium]
MTADTGITAFFPDHDRDLERLVFFFSKQATTLLVDLEAKEDHCDLASRADAVLAALPADLVHLRATVLPNPRACMQLLPYICDAHCRSQIAAFLDDASERQRKLSAWKASFTGILGSGYSAQWLFADPLGLRETLLDPLRAMRTYPAPDPLLGYPLHEDGRHVLLVLEPHCTLQDVDTSTRLVNALKEALTRHASDCRVTVSGGVLYAAKNRETVSRDIESIVGLSFVAFALIYLLFVRTPGAVWLLLVPGYAASVGLACTVCVYPVVSALALGFGASILGLAEDYAVHTQFALRYGGHAACSALQIPLFQGFCVNAAGFLVLCLSGIPALRQLAVFSLGTLATGYLLAVFALPHLPWFASRPLCAKAASAQKSAPHLPRLLLSFALLFAALSFLSSRITIDVTPAALGIASEAMQADAERIRRLWGIAPRTMVLVEGADRDEALARTRLLAAQIREEHPSASCFAVSDLIPDAATRETNRAAFQAFLPNIPAMRESFVAYFREQGIREDACDGFFSLFSREPEPFSQELLRAAGFGDLLTHGFIQHRGREYALLVSSVPPKEGPCIHVLGPETVRTRIEENFAQESRLVPLAWLVCCLLLFLFHRSLPAALLSSLPPLCSLTCILCAFVLSGEAITLAGLAAMPLVLGLSCDHGIMVTHDLEHGVRTGVNRAVLVSTLTSLSGMGLLALAEHPTLRSMGEVIFWGLVVEIPCAILLLPALCKRLSCVLLCLCLLCGCSTKPRRADPLTIVHFGAEYATGSRTIPLTGELALGEDSGHLLVLLPMGQLVSRCTLRRNPTVVVHCSNRGLPTALLQELGKQLCLFVDSGMGPGENIEVACGEGTMTIRCVEVERE